MTMGRFEKFWWTVTGISMFARSENFVELLEQNDFDNNHFPIYFIWLRSRFHAKVKTHRLHNATSKASGSLFIFKNLCHLVK